MDTPDQEQLKTSKLKQDITSKLRGFSPPPKDIHYSDLMSNRLSRDDFPVPEMVLFVLRNIMEWPYSGHEDKVRWTVYGALNGQAVAFQYRKFGLTLLTNTASPHDTRRIILQLQSAIKTAEKFLKPVIEEQIDNGQVVIANHQAEFNSRYLFFRNKANTYFQKASTPPKNQETQSKNNIKANLFISDLLAPLRRNMKYRQQGFYYSVAMVDCYFSYLEHRLNMLRAFIGRPLTTGDMRSFFKLKWDQKLIEVLGPGQPSSTLKIIESLKNIKERVRNPFAHGGFENDKGALHVHIPTIGLIPGNITKFKNSVRFSMIPIQENNHEENCRTFDEIDKLLSSDSLSKPHSLMISGIDPSYAPEIMAEYLEAQSKDDEYLERYIEHWSDMWEREANMDY